MITLMLATVLARLEFNQNGSFKFLHVSDVHLRYNDTTSRSEDGDQYRCQDIPESPWPCSDKNTTDFISKVISAENPDMVIFTGDIVDGDGHPPVDGMHDVYSEAFSRGLPWAATLGNHDDNEGSMNKSQLMSYIVGLPGTYSQMGNSKLLKSWGNFYIDYFKPGEEEPVFRTWHLDSDANFSDPNDLAMQPEQVDWYRETRK